MIHRTEATGRPGTPGFVSALARGSGSTPTAPITRLGPTRNGTYPESTSLTGAVIVVDLDDTLLVPRVML